MKKWKTYHSDVSNEKFDSIIIGSGIGGLCAAALLGIKGKRVLVLEKHFKIGGWTHTFKRKDYEWDVGIHYIGQVHQFCSTPLTDYFPKEILPITMLQKVVPMEIIY